MPLLPAHYISQVDFPSGNTDLPSMPFQFTDEFGSFNSAGAGYIGIVDITGLLGTFANLREISVSVTKLNVSGGTDFRMALINENGEKLTVGTGLSSVSTSATPAGWVVNSTYTTYIAYNSSMTQGDTYTGTITYDTDFSGGSGNLRITRDGVFSSLTNTPARRVFLAWRAKDGASNNQWQLNYVVLKVGYQSMNQAMRLTTY